MKKNMFIIKVVTFIVIVCFISVHVTAVGPIGKKFVPTQDPQLVIIAPSTVYENDYFFITITANSNPVEGVEVLFNQKNYTTGTDGKVIPQAPKVDNDTNFTITATKQEYLDAETTILVKDKDTHYPVAIDIEFQNVMQYKIIKVVLENPDTEDMVNLSWNMSLAGGKIFKGKYSTGTIPRLSPEVEKQITSLAIFGFGKTIVTVTVQRRDDGYIDQASANAIIFGPFMKIKV
jgi:hypothetical protein